MAFLTETNSIPVAEPVVAPNLVVFTPAHAALVTGWVRSDGELFRLSPRTAPPFTADKLLEWHVADGYAFLYQRGPERPCGYLELNPMKSCENQWWIGHCLVAPEHRNEGIGRHMVQQALDHAFLNLSAQQVCLVVFPSNHNAVQCYQKVGFRFQQEVHREFETRPGRYRMYYMVIPRRRYEKLHS